MDDILAALRADEPTLSEVDDGVRRFVDLAREVHRALEVVILEGPGSLAAVADRVTRNSRELAEVMRRMVDDAHAGETARRAEDLAVAAQREHLLYQTVQDFRRAARDTINGGD